MMYNCLLYCLEEELFITEDGCWISLNEIDGPEDFVGCKTGGDTVGVIERATGESFKDYYQNLILSSVVSGAFDYENPLWRGSDYDDEWSAKRSLHKIITDKARRLAGLYTTSTSSKNFYPMTYWKMANSSS